MYCIGGILNRQLLDLEDEIYEVNPKEGHATSPVLLTLPPDDSRPLLIGLTTASIGNSIAIIGGSAVCFSFGTFWNS